VEVIAENVGSDRGTVLVGMDFQPAVVDKHPSHGALDAARRAIRAARANGVGVIFVRVAFRPGYPEASPHNATFGPMARAADVAMTEDHPAAQIHPALEPRPDEPVVLKRRVSAFSGSDLDALLRAAGVRTLVLTGVATGGVVLSTLRQAADLDYRLVVLSDACGDRDPEVHRLLIEKVFPRQANVLTTTEWIKTLPVDNPDRVTNSHDCEIAQ
jgi:nicotinamidase-related amidase